MMRQALQAARKAPPKKKHVPLREWQGFGKAQTIKDA